MNRAQRRAAQYTKAGRRAHAEATRYICEHGNWMKTDGTGKPMCPHWCGFEHLRPTSKDDAVSFEARYPGICTECDERFNPGEIITYNDDGDLVHEHHEAPLKREDDPDEACTKCWTIHAGECL